jgi:hypothetical protein
MSNLHNRLQRLEQSNEAQSENYLVHRGAIMNSPKYKTLLALAGELTPEKRGELNRQLCSTNSPLKILKSFLLN